MAGSSQFPSLAVRQPFRLSTRPAPRPARNPETAPGHSCAMDTPPCFKALSGIGRMRRFGGAAGGVSSRFRGFEDRVRKSGALGSWLCRSCSTNNERRAGAAEALLARCLNYNHPQGFWMRGGGFDRDKIKAQAAKSVDIMCAASAQGGLPCAD